MQELGKKISANSIDMIFTDPPYKEASLFLYGGLAELAQRVLKPGGSLITFAGHYAIFKINDLIRSNSDLRYHWQIIVKHNGSKSRMNSHKVWPYYKPLLWYYKLGADGNGNGPTMYHEADSRARKEVHWNRSSQNTLF